MEYYTMATVQIDGSSAVTLTSTVNNGGVMKANGGDVTGALLSTNATASEDVGVFASVVVSGVNTDGVVSGGEFAHNHQQPISFLMTAELGGVANTALNSPADINAYVRNPAPLEVLRTRRLTTAIRAGEWNIYTGDWGTDPTVAVDSWWSITAGSGVSDVPDTAATPSQDVPGYLHFIAPSMNTVTNTTYKPRTLG
jgi:hypothetical protein